MNQLHARDLLRGVVFSVPMMPIDESSEPVETLFVGLSRELSYDPSTNCTPILAVTLEEPYTPMVWHSDSSMMHCELVHDAPEQKVHKALATFRGASIEILRKHLSDMMDEVYLP